MDATQFDLLIQVISQATSVLGWVVGTFLAVLITVVGGSLGLVSRMWGQRLDAINAIAERAVTVAETATMQSTRLSEAAQQGLHQAGVHCSELRSACREQILEKYVDRKEIKEMEHEFKGLVQSVLSRLEGGVRENRDLILKKLDDFTKRQDSRLGEFLETVHKHEHTEDGKSVVVKR
jgi:DNA anti-recombination protein RmuC